MKEAIFKQLDMIRPLIDETSSHSFNEVDKIIVYIKHLMKDL